MFIFRLLFLAVIMTRPNYDTTFILVNLQELYRDSMVLKVCLELFSYLFPSRLQRGGNCSQYIVLYVVQNPRTTQFKILQSIGNSPARSSGQHHSHRRTTIRVRSGLACSCIATRRTARLVTYLFQKHRRFLGLTP